MEENKENKNLFEEFKDIILKFDLEENYNSILLEADKIVNGERQTDYSDPVQNFKHISNIASVILGKELTPEDCCVVLMAVKLARESYKHKRDKLVDLAGYTEIFNRIKENNKK